MSDVYYLAPFTSVEAYASTKREKAEAACEFAHNLMSLEGFSRDRATEAMVHNFKHALALSTSGFYGGAYNKETYELVHTFWADCGPSDPGESIDPEEILQAALAPGDDASAYDLHLAELLREEFGLD